MNTQGSETVNQEGVVETKVETVDYRSTAGQDEPGSKEKVGVVHLKGDKNENPGVLAKTVAAVSNTVKSAKEAIIGKAKDQTPT